jgi:hypothetical protein
MAWYHHLIYIIPIISVLLFHFVGDVGWFGSIFFTVAFAGTLLAKSGGIGIGGGGGGSSSSSPPRPPIPTPYGVNDPKNHLNGGKRRIGKNK